LQIGPPKQDIADLFYLKPFIYGLSSDVAPELSNSKTIFATHPCDELRGRGEVIQ